MPAIRLISFGYLHLQGTPPPAADRVEDVRGRLRDPAAAKDILDLDGRDPRVQQIVLSIPGARELLANLADYASLPAGPQAIATGCSGGKHRAAAITELLGRELRARGFDVTIEHRHVHLPRILYAGWRAAALVTVTCHGTQFLLMTERERGWVVPSRRAGPGELARAAIRALAEETGLAAMSETGVYIVVRPAMHDPGPGSPDEALALTWPVHIGLGDRDALPAVCSGDDDGLTEWIAAESYDQLRGALASYFEADVSADQEEMLDHFLSDIAAGSPSLKQPGGGQ